MAAILARKSLSALLSRQLVSFQFSFDTLQSINQIYPKLVGIDYLLFMECSFCPIET